MASEDKFGRRYQLLIELRDGSILDIELPFTIEFDTTRNILPSQNCCQVRIYNLNDNHRDQIRFNNVEFATLRTFQLRAGYGKNIPVVFTGNITQAWSVREGTNFITQLEAFDGGFAFTNSHIDGDDGQFPKGTTNKVVTTTLAEKLGNVNGVDTGITVGAIGNNLTGGSLVSRGLSLSGSTVELIKERTGGANSGFFVDKGKANVLDSDEFINANDGLTVINSKSGLLGTPMLEQTIAHFDMIFEPALNSGYLIQIQSITGLNFNGKYIVTSVKHRGMVSPAVCGAVVTTGQFFYNKRLVGVTPHG